MVASNDDAPVSDEADNSSDIDTLDTNALVQRALRKQEAEPERQGS
jgi:hypothetical protein